MTEEKAATPLPPSHRYRAPLPESFSHHSAQGLRTVPWRTLAGDAEQRLRSGPEAGMPGTHRKGCLRVVAERGAIVRHRSVR